MIIIFQCYGGTHTSVAAAAIYTGRLPSKRPPHPVELDNLPHFDRIPSSRAGILHFCGVDRDSNPVFTLGSWKWGPPVRKLLAAWLELQGRDKPIPEVAVIDCLAHVTLPVRLGGILSRRAGLIFPGRRLVNYGIRKNYGALLKLVERFERERASFAIGRRRE